MNEWIDDLVTQAADGKACVLVTVAGVRGSAPREIGAKMLVTARETLGTIGGGQLEYQCTQIACQALRDQEDGASLRRFTLGASVGQCCGGVVEVLFESYCSAPPAWLDELCEAYRSRRPLVVATLLQPDRPIQKRLIPADRDNAAGDRENAALRDEAVRILTQSETAQRKKIVFGRQGEVDVLLEPITSSNMNIAVFGAGHVGAATVRTLAALDCNIRWIDSRRNFLPERVPANVLRIEGERPEREVAAMPPGSFYLVMTHSHPLDLQIVHRILGRDDFAYCGLIGSASKRRRFEKRLLNLGVSRSRMDRLTCPIGLGGVGGKKPAEIAIAVAAELLRIAAARSGAELPGEPKADNVRFLR